MLIDLELNTADFSAVYKADNGQEYECFNLDKENTLILVSGYNVKINKKKHHYGAFIYCTELSQIRSG